MYRNQTTTEEEPGLLLKFMDGSGAGKTFGRLTLVVVGCSLFFSPMFAGEDRNGQVPQGAHRPAYRLLGDSLATLRATPLPARPTTSARTGMTTIGPAPGQPGAGAEIVRGRVLVAFQDGTPSSAKQEILSQASGELQLSSNPGSAHFDIIQITGEGITVGEAIDRLRGNPRVRIAEPDYIVRAQDKVPNDEYFSHLWGLQNVGQGPYSTTCKTCSKPGADISAAKAWDLTTGSSEVVVAVIDTGVDYNHPDLAANILHDSSGRVVGYDYANKDDDPMDDVGHGTHCAGTIGAVGDNGKGVAGVCWNVKIMPLKFLSESGGYTSDAVSCIDFAIAHGAHILSNSWGGGGGSQLLLDAIRRAEKAGILFVAAAGNSAMDIDSGGFYPANFNQYASNVIAVAATDSYDVLASFSNYGPKTCDIAAPGTSIYSTVPSGSCPYCSSAGYNYLSGTSMATPHVAGAAALVKARYPGASATELRARLLYSGDHPPEMEGYTRGGRLNVYNAMQSDTVPPGSPSNFSIADASGTGLRLTWTASGDDGLTGTASAYQIFYNTISDLSTATMVEPLLRPGPPGAAETFDLTGLVPNTAYYVSIRAVDKVGNTSAPGSVAPVLTNGTDFFDGAESTLQFGESGYDQAWTVATDDAHTGQHSFASASRLSSGKSSTLQMTGTYKVKGPAYLAFWAKTDLDYGTDFFDWFVQDLDTGRRDFYFGGTGTSNWGLYRSYLGTYIGHTIKVSFYVGRGGNDPSISSHCAWVDDVVIVPLTSASVDDVEGAAQFTGFPPWGISTENSSSPSHAWSDSPNANYASNVRLPLMQNSSVTPPAGLGSFSLVFNAKIDLEAGRDFLEVYASPDDGTTWEYLGYLTGASDWTTYSYNLPGWKKARTLFYLVTNEVIARDGVHIDDVGVWGESFTAARIAPSSPERTTAAMAVSAGGANSVMTGGSSGSTSSGYATLDVSSGGSPYGTAVLSLTQGGTVVSEAAVAASAPTTSARVFIDYRAGVVPVPATPGTGTVDIYTGVALVNRGSAAAKVSYTLRDQTGAQRAAGQGTLASGAHIAKFIHQLKEAAPDFDLPADFPTATRFGTLEIGSDQPLAVTALRLTANQRGDLLLTTTPVADLNKSTGNSPLYFPQFVDGAGYATTVVLLNASSVLETGSIAFFGDDGNAVAVTAEEGTAGSSFAYSIQPGGVYVLRTNGAPASILAGSIQVTPAGSTPSPVGAGVLSYSSGGVRVTESGVPAAVPTTHARIFIDQSQGHDTGLAVASSNASGTSISFKAYRTDGSTAAGSATDPVKLAGNGHLARYAGQLVAGLPAGFTGVLDISASSPFVAVTLRSLKNARGDLLLTTCPVADLTQPAPVPIVFPHIADGGGYSTQFILLSPGAASGSTLRFYGENGAPLAIGK